VKLKDETTREVDEFVLHDGYLILGRKLCISRTSCKILCLKIASRCLAGHCGNEKIIKALEFRFYWPSLKCDVVKHVSR